MNQWTIAGYLSPSLAFSTDDERWMFEALSSGQQGAGISNPNPSVGCMLVKNGQRLGSGGTEAFRQRHAERVACDSVDADALRGATAYVTLEPCSHVGHQPACADLLIERGITRVVIAIADPNPKVAGQGIARLRAAGIAVELGVLESAATLWHLPFLLHQKRARPLLIGKWAQTPDGLLADDLGNSKWITGPEARVHVHRLRQKYDAVLVSAGTVLADRPRLTVRDSGWPAGRNPVRMILDLKSRIQEISAELLAATFSEEAPTVLFLAEGAPTPRGLPKAVTVVRLAGGSEASRWPALRAWLQAQSTSDWLGRPFQSVMVEGGAELLNSGLREAVFDILHVYTGSPKFSGTKHRVDFDARASGFQIVSENKIGPDTLKEYLRSTEQ